MNSHFIHISPEHDFLAPFYYNLFLRPRSRPKEGTVIRKNLGDGGAIGVQVVEPNGISPPVWEVCTAETEGDSRDDNAYGRADVEGSG